MCTAYFQLIRPPKDTQVKGVIIFLPHGGDEWYEYRKSILDDGGMINKGYVGVLPMIPFYGKRRGESQSRNYIRTVELSFKCLIATAIEAASLVRWGHKTFPGAPVCIAGSSQGGAIACFTACVAQDPVSIASVVGFDTQRPILSNPSTLQLDWEALIAERPGCSCAAVRDELLELFSSRSTSIKSKLRTDSVLERAVCVNARYDAWLNSTEYNDLENALRRMTGNNVSIEWVSGGHIAAVLLKPGRLMNPAIISAFNHQL
jgi:predicted esterase